MSSNFHKVLFLKEGKHIKDELSSAVFDTAWNNLLDVWAWKPGTQARIMFHAFFMSFYEQVTISIMKRYILSVIAILICVMLSAKVLNASVINHNIGTGNLIISGNSTNDYVVTGSTTNHYIKVQLGYHGSITLKNCSFIFSGSGVDSPIRVIGKDGQSNEHPLTIVNIILEGNNTIQNDGGGRACIQVDQGAQINISAIDPCDNNSGILIARQLNDDGGAAIGSLNHWQNTNEPTANAYLSTGGTGTTAGGNVVVSSGTITARGGHGAGIGGGFATYYDGMIVIYGGVVNATADFDAAGIGSGCPEGTGVIQVFAPHSAVIALPPAVISAKGAGASASGGVGHNLFSELGLAGTKVRVYIGDPGMTNCPIRVYTEDHTPDANIYVDLSQDPDINRVVSATVDPDLLDIHQVFFGTTDATGVYSTTGKLNNNTTFFTDAISTSPNSYGHPYLPKVTTLPSGGNVQLEKLMADFRIEAFASSMLVLGYSSAEALANATCVKLVYNDANPIEDVQFDLANGYATDFDDLIFFAADSTTVIPAPTTLVRGDIYYIVIPIKTGKEAYLFSDVFRIIGVWQGTSTSYIRQIVTQIVGDMHTEYICSGGSYWFHGEELTEEGVYSNVTTTTSQCQAISTVEILNLIVNPPVSSSFEAKMCDKFVWNGISYTTTGQYEQLFQDQFGCDSVVTLNLTIFDSYSTIINVLGCESFEWDGTTYTLGGEYTKFYESVHGCDSVVTTNLDMNYTPSFVIQGDHWPIGGTELEWTQYPYNIVFDNPLCVVDEIVWSVDCPTMFVFPDETGMSCDLRIYSYLPPMDSVPLHAVASNRCGTEDYTFWIHTSYHDVGENLLNKKEISAFPNPTQGLLNLNIKGYEGNVVFELYDAKGIIADRWYSNVSGEGFIVRDVSKLRDGVYALKVIHNEDLLIKKIIVGI